MELNVNIGQEHQIEAVLNAHGFKEGEGFEKLQSLTFPENYLYRIVSDDRVLGFELMSAGAYSLSFT